MKKSLLRPVFIFLMLLFVASTSCTSDSDNNNSNDITALTNIMKQGTWRIASYIDSGDDETHHFIGYNFTFANNNLLTATNSTNTYNGTWSITNSSSSSSSSGDLDFNIAFASPANFAELTDDWDVVSFTSTTVSLIDISGGNGGTDILVFQKN